MLTFSFFDVFSKSFFGIPKMDKKKCPKSKNPKYFWKNIQVLKKDYTVSIYLLLSIIFIRKNGLKLNNEFIK